VNVLTIESATNLLEIAVVSERGVVSQSTDYEQRMAESLLPVLQNTLVLAGLAPNAVDMIALNKGPGSFTSLRLGFALAKGFSLAAGCPIYAVPSTRVYAHPFDNFKAAVVSAIDAKRGRFYAAVFRRGKEVTPAGDYTPAQIASFLDPEAPALLAGPSAQALKEHLQNLNPLAALFTVDSPVRAHTALDALSRRMRAQGQPPLQENEGPLYIRLSEAEENMPT
jgi:tRNA threonylcarbamoyladenosine biosynthesis protein TsaB